MLRETRQPLWRRVVNGVTASLAVAAVGTSLRGAPQAPPREEIVPELQRGTLKEELLRQGWATPIPEKLVKPTYWPFILALGITFLLGGIATRWLISAIGLFLFVLGMVGWIYALLDEQEGHYD